MREPGPLKRKELRAFQEAVGAKIDGVFGNQTMGEVHRLYGELAGCRRSVFTLERRVAKLEAEKPWWAWW